MTIQITYITIDDTYRIEVMPSGNHYPQHLVNPQWREDAEGWGYWKTGSKQKHFKTEAGALKFLGKHAWDTLQAVPAYVERAL